MKRKKKTFVDNEFYDRDAAYWWSDTESPLAIIRYMMNPIRFAFVIRHLVELTYNYRGRKVLDIGCGGGFLTEEIAKFGLDTTGIDPSVPSLRTAREHARALNLDITYHEGVGESLEFPDNHFDMVFCLDVLEHVQDYRKVVAEIERVLVPGGFFFFETVNRTLVSYLVVIFFMQNFPPTRVMPSNIHSWRHFIKPRELRRAMESVGLRQESIKGVMPGWGFVRNLPQLPKIVADKIDFRDLCALFRCHESIFKSLCYLGYARKPPLHQ